MDIHARREQKMNAPCSRVATDEHAHSIGQLDVPGRCQCDTSGVGRRRSVVAHAEGAVRHLECGQLQAVDAANVKAIHAAEKIDFFLDRQFGQNGFGALLDVLGRGCSCGISCL